MAELIIFLSANGRDSFIVDGNRRLTRLTGCKCVPLYKCIVSPMYVRTEWDMSSSDAWAMSYADDVLTELFTRHFPAPKVLRCRWFQPARLTLIQIESVMFKSNQIKSFIATQGHEWHLQCACRLSCKTLCTVKMYNNLILLKKQNTNKLIHIYKTNELLKTNFTVL